MTQVSSPLYGRAYDLIARARCVRGNLKSADGMWQKIVASAHKFGCFVVEDDGRHVAVQPKWLLPIIRRRLDGSSLVAGINLLRRLARVDGRAIMRHGAVYVSRSQIRTWQSWAAEE